MSPDESVTHWLGLLQRDGAAAAQRLWERYFHRRPRRPGGGRSALSAVERPLRLIRQTWESEEAP